MAPPSNTKAKPVKAHMLRRDLDDEHTELVCGRVAPRVELTNRPSSDVVACDDCQRAAAFEIGL